MVRGKKECSWICTVHVATYMIPLLFIGLSWWQLSLIAVEHWLQDRSRFVAWYMRAFGKSEFAKPPLAPWSFIMMDNVFHITWIAFIVWMGTNSVAL
ncbi:MAG: hypothetical protein ACRED0_08240 [Gammaproteobacteria bacterium]